MPTRPFSARLLWPVLVILIASALLYTRLAYRHPIGFFGDDALYILSAHSLWSGHFQDLTRIEHPPEIHILPGFSVFLAPFTIDLSHVAGLHILPGLLAVLAGGLAWLLFRQRLTERWACVALVLFAFNPLTLMLSDVLLSEWWLLCLSLLAFLLIGDLETHRASRPRQILLALVLAWAALTRPEGILVSASLIAASWSQPGRSKISPWMGLCPVVAFATWMLRNFLLSGHVSAYTRFWHPPGPEHVLHTLSAILRIPYGIELRGVGSWLLTGIGGLMSLVGFRKIATDRSRLGPFSSVLYVSLFIVLHALWPSFDERFFLPILPFLCAYVVDGCIVLSQKQPPRFGKILAGGVLLGLCVQDIGHPEIWTANPLEQLPVHMLSFLRDHLPPQATVLTNKGPLMTLYTGRYNSGSIHVSTADELAYGLLKAGTSAVWVKRQTIVDPHVQAQWKRVSRWLTDWPTAFPVQFDDGPEASTLYAVHIAPVFETAYVNYLNAHDALQKGRYAEARHYFETAIRLYPDFPGALNDYAALLLEKGDAHRAELLLQAALQKRSHFALARLNLARAEELQNKIEQAIENLRLASGSATDPDDADLRQWIEEAYQQVQSHRKEFPARHAIQF